MSAVTVNRDAAARLVEAQRRADKYDDWRTNFQIATNPAVSAKMQAIREAGERTEWQTRLHGPFLQKTAPVWAKSGLCGWPEIVPERAAEHERFEQAEADFAQYSEEETGLSVSPDELKRQREDRAKVKRMSHLLAGRLEQAGVKAYRDDPFQLWVWWIHSATAEEIPAFRRICFLPYVSAIVRAPKLAALEYFMQKNPFCRFWTFTSGERIGIAGLGDRIRQLHKRLNRLNKSLRKLWGVEMVFRSTELGTPETAESMAAERAKREAIRANKKARETARKAGRPDPGPLSRAQLKKFKSAAGGIETASGEPLFHPHAHTVVKSLNGYMPPDRWESMIRWVWDHWGNHWDAGRIIGDARECCKYVTKPAEMLKLTPEQLAGVEAQLHGLRLVCPLGELKREISARRSAGKILRRQRTPDGMVWREAFDQNKHIESDQADRDAIFRMHQAEVIERIDSQVGYLGEGTLRRLSEPDSCQVLARQAPAIGPRGLKEPRVIVGGRVLDRARIEAHPLVEKLWAGTVQAWEAGLAISVHTGTPTGPETPSDFHSTVPERSKPPSGPVFAGQN